ncbi:hypothetical protein AAGS61_07105 [Lysinibacillus sp. KU-BSD001]|uniref:hypothetical protein n=1 Tax=Lysinibacillus sp. KU-BSD001 TaxID=3141328 RepID=UPI0036EE3E5D
MTKKLLLLGAFMAMLAACGSEEDSAEPVEKTEPAAVIEESEEAEAEVEYYELTVPAEFAYDIEQNADVAAIFEEITENADGSMTYIMETNMHEAFMPELAKEFDFVIQEIVDTYPGYEEIRYSDAYDVFEIDVDLATFEEGSGTEALYQLVLLTGMYNAFAGYEPEDIAFTFDFFDLETGEAVVSLAYPDDF